ncbi:nitroreductase/quinone reductase family protein [Streptomyces sp. NRRL F-5630]|uniref:nitroreductase/quinone reductase family protein n=1 Tax=Streptomyces sp. NRRL F-5630 TaxID=1463864 RepID=UPI003EBFAC28
MTDSARTPPWNAIRQALAIDTSSTAWERTVDITTIGAKTGKARRIEIWFHHIDDRWYLSSTPARRDWYRNLQVNPQFTFHLKHGVHADLRATALPVTDPERRRRFFQYIVDDVNQPHNPALVHQPQRVQDWIDGSPLLEIVFNDLPEPENTGK